MKKDVLGRGLGALLSADLKESVSETERIKELDLENIDANPNQPREHFNDEHLGELADSIKKHGVLQPVVVRRAGERYQLVVGERRFRASKLAPHGGRSPSPGVLRQIDLSEDIATLRYF